MPESRSEVGPGSQLRERGLERDRAGEYRLLCRFCRRSFLHAGQRATDREAIPACARDACQEQLAAYARELEEEARCET